MVTPNLGLNRAALWLELVREAAAAGTSALNVTQIGLNLGEELYRGVDATVAPMRRGLVGVRAASSESFTDGYLSALGDILAGYELARTAALREHAARPATTVAIDPPK
jgi:hypothetical protein